MKFKSGLISLLLVCLALLLGVEVLSWAQQPTQTRLDGMLVSYNVTNPIRDGGGIIIGSEYLYLYMAESLGTSGAQPNPVKQWRLNFTVRRMLSGTPQQVVQLTGSGPIADEYVTLGKPKGKSLALDVDISALPLPGMPYNPLAFSRQKTCSPDPLACNPAIDMDIGVIDLQWEWINDLWNRSEGHSVIDFGDYWQHSQGFTDQNGALVSGTLFGIEISPVEFGFTPGRIGWTRTMVTTHQK